MLFVQYCSGGVRLVVFRDRIGVIDRRRAGHPPPPHTHTHPVSAVHLPAECCEKKRNDLKVSISACVRGVNEEILRVQRVIHSLLR